MALYLGSKKQKITATNFKCTLNLFSSITVTNGIRLLSFDNYILKDSNGLYLTIKESE